MLKKLYCSNKLKSLSVKLNGHRTAKKSYFGSYLGSYFAPYFGSFLDSFFGLFVIRLYLFMQSVHEALMKYVFSSFVWQDQGS